MISQLWKPLAMLALAAAALGTASVNWAGGPKGGGSSTGGTATPTDNTYAGRATALMASVTTSALGLSATVRVTTGDTGELDATTGGMRDSSFLNLVNGSLGLDLAVLSAVTVGSGNTTDSSASTAGLTLNLAGLRVSAGVMRAGAVAQCSNGNVAYSASANVADLVVQGNAVVVTGAPNQTITVNNLATIIVNEQYEANGRQVVNALHIKVGGSLAGTTSADIVVSHAEAGISCGTTTVPSCPVTDFMTGGGYITLPSGAKGTFGFVGGKKANGLQGHLQYVDHGSTGPDISGSAVASYSGSGTARNIGYNCSVNGSATACTINVADNGEPGKNVDTFTIGAGNYSASGPALAQGNIQLHKPNCPTSTGKKR